LDSGHKFGSLEDKIRKYSTLRLTRNTALILILIFTAIAVFDSMIAKLSSYSGIEFPLSVNLAIFVFSSVIFVLFGVILMDLTKKNLSYDANRKTTPIGVKYFHWFAIITVVLLISIIIVIFAQMLTYSHYDITLLRIQTYLTHISPIVFLSYLIFLLLRWSISSKKNLTTMLYALSFSLVSVNLMVSLIYLETYFSTSPVPYVRPYPIYISVASLGGLPLTESLSTVFDALSLSSFLLTWIATAILLSQYQRRMGRVRYYILMSIPLVYYIFPFQNYFGDILLPLLQSSPVTVSIFYVLIFSASKQVGALFFSLAFWTASSIVHDGKVRQSLLLTSIGIAILFGSIELTPLQYLIYPPYGIISEAFIPIGAYLLFAGIFASAKYVSGDAKLRKEFYKTAVSQLSLLKSIGISQMEKDLEEKIKFVHRSSTMDELDEEPNLEEANVKEILHDVLTELHSKKTGIEEKST
jgi:hypothetical protein